MRTQDTLNILLLVIVAGLLLLNWSSTGPAAEAAGAGAAGAITVSGSSAIRVPPDRVVVLLGVATFAHTPSASQQRNAELSRQVLQAIRDCGVAEKEIATADFTIQPKYEDYDDHVISGYWSRSTIGVTLLDVEKLEPVLVSTLAAGATSVDGIEFSVTNLRQLRDEARDLAVQAALEKAEAIASAAGTQVGAVTGIHEDAWYSGYSGWRGGRSQWTNVQNVVQDLASEGAITMEDGSISLGQIVVKAQVSLTAQIASAK